MNDATAGRSHVATGRTAESRHRADAIEVWAAIQGFVAANDVRLTLQEALELGRGTGRVKLLLLLLLDGPLPARDIADATGFDRPYVTVVVDQLVARGLVERRSHPDDNRQKLVSLTEAGESAASKALRITSEPPAPLLEMSIDDLVVLKAAFDRLSELGARERSASGRGRSEGPTK